MIGKQSDYFNLKLLHDQTLRHNLDTWMRVVYMENDPRNTRKRKNKKRNEERPV